MRCHLAALLLTLGFGATALGADPIPSGTPRDLVPLNGGWRFFAGDEPKASEAAFDDHAWHPVDLPHTWNGLDGEDGGNNYRRGAGWYRRHIFVGDSLKGRRLYLQFDGASLMADVYVNGTHLGNHMGGFARFRFDATGALKVGADNVLAVRVDNSNLGIPPTTSDFTIFGGLYRGVSLLATDDIQISPMDMASSGVFVEARPKGNDALLLIRAELADIADAPRDVDVRVLVLDEGRNVVAGEKGSFTTRLDPGGVHEILKPLTLVHPHLWQGMEDPYLYTVRIELRPVFPGNKTGDLVDAVEDHFGVRFFSVDADNGFILNGRPVSLHGYNRHQDWPDKGWAISDANEAEDFSILLDSGANAVRTSHYQDSQSWYDRCDRAGVAVWTEIPNWQKGSEAPLYLENGKQQLRELIRQNFNHPSIFFWGVGNETYGPAADSLCAAFAKVAKEEDPGRLTTYASNHDASDPKNFHTDVVGFNRYFGWYSGKISDFGPWLDATRAKYPKLRFGMSEFGAGASASQHEDDPEQPGASSKWHPEEYQDLYHEGYSAALRNRPYVWGTFIWCLFDFASDGRHEGDHDGRNDKGLVTYDRKTKKDAFYLYKSLWVRDPVLHIASSSFTERTQAATQVKVYSNAVQVWASLNGVSLGSRLNDGTNVFTWEPVTLSPGENRVAASARFSQGSATDGCVWTLSPR